MLCKLNNKIYCMKRKKEYMTPELKVIMCEYVSMICGSKPTELDSANSEESDWDNNRDIDNNEYGFE